MSEEIREKLLKDPDYICLKRFKNSLKNALERYPEGLPTKLICQALMVSETDLEVMERAIISKLQEKMKIELD